MSFFRRKISTSPSTSLSSGANMPSFLQQSSDEIQNRFEELEWEQRKRMANSMRKAPKGGPPQEWARLEGKRYAVLNRYTNIDPWEHNRVKLKVAAGYNDYINASPVTLKCTKSGIDKRYIATQGPTSTSTEHIWRMVLHSTGPVEDPAVIIMLTKTHESGREKCFQYFPHSEKSPIHLSPTDAFGDNLSGSINLVSSHYDDNARTTVRELQIDVKADGKKVQKKVWHLLFTGWPDFGVPSGEDRVALLSLVKLSDALNTGGTENPRVVHCSAGVGRSGTFIALDYLLGELNEGAMDDGQGVMGKNGHQAESPGKRRKTSSHGDGFEDDPIALTVDRLRQQRMMMVQGESQFHFLYELVRKQWLERQGRNREAKEKKEELASKK